MRAAARFHLPPHPHHPHHHRHYSPLRLFCCGQLFKQQLAKFSSSSALQMERFMMLSAFRNLLASKTGTSVSTWDLKPWSVTEQLERHCLLQAINSDMHTFALSPSIQYLSGLFLFVLECEQARDESTGGRVRQTVRQTVSQSVSQSVSQTDTRRDERQRQTHTHWMFAPSPTFVSFPNPNTAPFWSGCRTRCCARCIAPYPRH